MARLQQQVNSPLEAFGDALAPTESADRDDDLALGFECACPWLQFDSWEPIPDSRGGTPSAR